ncbi:MAG: hydrogenase 3 maturation endopeptidase HyCI [Candidatus Omnitrophica bacterium]|nr:hydrogenase 3 maturation endopeptidase HyCI [Candidatus Omnitrophota bacterium]
MRVRTILRNKLKDAGKLAVLGIGSSLRGDDAAGIAVARQVQAYAKKNKLRRLKVFLGETAPENLTGQIKKFNPSHLVIIDAMDFKGKAGAIGIFDLEAQEAGASFSTHRMPMRVFTDYLYKCTGCQSIIMGIQPRSLDFCAGLSPEIRESVRAASEGILYALKFTECA